MAFLQGISNQYLEQKVFLFLNQSINLQNSTVLIALMLSCLQTDEMLFHSLHCGLGEVPSNGALRLYSVHEDVSKGLPRQPFKTGKILNGFRNLELGGPSKNKYHVFHVLDIRDRTQCKWMAVKETPW